MEEVPPVETMALHRRSLFEEHGRSPKTTHCIENHNERTERGRSKVKCWYHPPKRHRWVVLARLQATRLRRLIGYRRLSKRPQR